MNDNVPAGNLTPEQRDGRACVICGDEHNPMTPAGMVAGVQVFACTLHPERTAPTRLPAADCPVPWCEAHMTTLDGPHTHLVADVGDRNAAVELSYCSDHPDGSSPFLRLTYGPDWRRGGDQLDVPLPAAAALADLLDLLPANRVPDLVTALRQAVDGPRTPKSTKW